MSETDIDRIRVESLALAEAWRDAVPVAVGRLDRIVDAVGELGSVQNALGKLLQSARAGVAPAELVFQAQRVQRSFERGLCSLRESAIGARRLPLCLVFDELGTLVEQSAQRLHKQLRWVVADGEIEVDQPVAAGIVEPLAEWLEYVTLHGIEPPEQRTARGKSAQATLAVMVRAHGSEIAIEIHDDGAGIDVERVRALAAQRGVLSEQNARGLSTDEVFELIFAPGFAFDAEDRSPRDAGLSRVRASARGLGGTVRVRAEAGVGTSFVLTVPATLAITDALLFTVRGRVMALPLAGVREVVRLEPVFPREVEGRKWMQLREDTIELLHVAELMSLPALPEAVPEQHVIVVGNGSRYLGLVVDRATSQRSIVIKRLGPSLRGVNAIAGAADLGDGRLALVVDAWALLDDRTADGIGQARADGGA
jgi:two-component system chemotaxis sensor kinase CheA